MVQVAALAQALAGCTGFHLHSQGHPALPVNAQLQRCRFVMDAGWTPRRKPYVPSWLRSDGGVYNEQRNEYEQYAQAQAGSDESARAPPAAAAVSPAPPPAVPASHGGKGFGGGEATRDPEPTAIDPNDPKSRQQAIHKAESFADYLRRRDDP